MTNRETGKEYILSALKKSLSEPMLGQRRSYKKWRFDCFLDSHILTEYMRVNGCDYEDAEAKCRPIISAISEKWNEGIDPEYIYSIVESEVQKIFQ